MTVHLTICIQSYIKEQVKRGLCLYNDRKYSLADLPDSDSK